MSEKSVTTACVFRHKKLAIAEETFISFYCSSMRTKAVASMRSRARASFGFSKPWSAVNLQILNAKLLVKIMSSGETTSSYKMPYFVKPLPSSRITIQHPGNKRSSCSNSLTYSNLELAIVLFNMNMNLKVERNWTVNEMIMLWWPPTLSFLNSKPFSSNFGHSLRSLLSFVHCTSRPLPFTSRQWAPLCLLQSPFVTHTFPHLILQTAPQLVRTPQITPKIHFILICNY